MTNLQQMLMCFRELQREAHARRDNDRQSLVFLLLSSVQAITYKGSLGVFLNGL